MEIRTFQDLTVWRKSMDLLVEIYGIVKLLPPEERHALSDQMRRAAVSIPSNIAEGHQRGTTKDYVRFLHIARGSKAELETQLLICVRLDYLSVSQAEDAQNLLAEIGRMLNSLIRKLDAKS